MLTIPPLKSHLGPSEPWQGPHKSSWPPRLTTSRLAFITVLKLLLFLFANSVFIYKLHARMQGQCRFHHHDSGPYCLLALNQYMALIEYMDNGV